MKKHVIITALAALLTVAALVLGFRFGGVSLEEAHAAHTHCICGGAELSASGAAAHGTCQNVEWTAWTSGTTLPNTAGYYYLTKNVTVSGQQKVMSPNIQIHICLNGFTVTGKTSGNAVVRLYRIFSSGTENGTGSTVCFTDCSLDQATGRAKGKIFSQSGNWDDHSLLWLSVGNMVFFRMNLDFSGTTIKTGPITVSNSNRAEFYDCDIAAAGDCHEMSTAATPAPSGNGGCIRATAGGKIYAYDSTFHGGNVNNYGGAIYVSGTNSECHLYNCTVEDSAAGNGGGGIYANSSGAVYLYDGTEIRNCKVLNKGANGGGIALTGNANLYIYGGKVINNKAANVGGNLALTGGVAFLMEDGEISGGSNYHYNSTSNEFMESGNLNSGNANVHLYNNTGTFTMTGGRIYGRVGVMGIKRMLLTEHAKIYDGNYGLTLSNNFQDKTNYSTGVYLAFSDATHALREDAYFVITDADNLTGNQAKVEEYYTSQGQAVPTNYATDQKGRIASLSYAEKSHFGSSKYTIAVMDTEGDDGIADALYVYSKTGANGHAHCICGGALTDGQVLGQGENQVTHHCADIVFTGRAGVTTGSSQYFTADFSKDSNAYNPASDTVTNICLNGKTLTNQKARVFQCNGKTGIVLNICDCSADHSGRIIGAPTQNAQGTVVWIPGDNNAFNLYGGTIQAGEWSGEAGNRFTTGLVVEIANNSCFAMYGGTLDGSVTDDLGSNGGTLGLEQSATAIIYRGTVKGSTKANYNGGAINVATREGTANLYIYGGEISGCAKNGGAIYVRTYKHVDTGATGTANVYLYGGTITGTASSQGGGLYLTQENGGTTYAALYEGCVITDGKAHWGGNISLYEATLDMYGGEIKDGTAMVFEDDADQTQEVGAGNIHIRDNSVFTMYAGTIKGGTSSVHGGNIRVNGTMRMKGGLIENGQADSQGGNIFVNIGNDAGTRGVFTMEGGTVKNGTALKGGGNIHGNGSGTHRNSTIRIQGGTVKQDGDFVSAAGGANILSYGTLEISGGTITGGKSTIHGGSVVVYPGSASRTYAPVLTMTGGTITGGEAASFGGNLVVKGASDNSAIVTISGGTIENGTARDGGNVLIDVYSNATISGTALIKDGTTTGTGENGRGGNLFVYGDLTLDGACVTGGTAATQGGNIANVGTGRLTVRGTAVIASGEATTGGNLLNLAAMTVENGTIRDGHSSNGAGGNLRQDGDNASFTMTGGAFLNGTAVRQDGTPEIQNAFFSKGSVAVSGGVFDGKDDELSFFIRYTTVKTKEGASTGNTISVSGGYIAGSLTLGKEDTSAGNYVSGGYFTLAPGASLLASHRTVKTLETPAEIQVGQSAKNFAYTVVPAKAILPTSSIEGTEVSGMAALSGGGLYGIGETVTLTAPLKASCYEFIGWFRDAYEEGKALQGGNSTITLTVDENFEDDSIFVAAYRFETEVFTLSVKASAFTVKIGDAEEVGAGGTDAPWTTSVNSGETVTVRFIGGAEIDFYGWRNESGKTVSGAKEYVFTMLKEVVVTASEASKIAEEKTVVFMNDSQQIVRSFAGVPDVLPELPVRIGFTGAWNKTLSEIEASESKYVVVTAVYTEDTSVTDYQVTIQAVTAQSAAGDWTNAGDPVILTARLGTRVTLQAAEMDGKTFAFFAAKDGESTVVLSYSGIISTVFGADTTVYAVYMDDAVQAAPTMTLQVTKIQEAGGVNVKFTATRDITEGYALVEHGILYGVGAKGEEEMYYGGARAAVSNATGMKGTVSLNVGLVPTGYAISARGYAILSDLATGEIRILYSDIIVASAE